MKKLTDQQKIDIVTRYQQGESSVKLSKEFKVSTRAILSILKVRNIEMRDKNGK